MPSLLRLRSYKTVAGIVNGHADILCCVKHSQSILWLGNPYHNLDLQSDPLLRAPWGVFLHGWHGALVEQLHQLLVRVGVKVVLNTDIEEITMKGATQPGEAVDGACFLLAG